MSTPLVDLSPLPVLAALAATVAAPPLAWWWWRGRGTGARARLAALTALTLFLTFDLIVFGAFTRLTDSGLGCPDWPGCYGEASPFGARAQIADAQAALPGGPVTWGKAWIEMIHRYLAMAVGLLILIAAVAAWFRRQELPHSPWWGVATLVWVVVQGLFGKYTVTLKLYPAVVTLHLLGGMVLLLLLVLQHESFRDRPVRLAWPRAWVGGVLGLVLAQVALGGWVSTNYAVLACSGFPTCNGQWWPPMDAAQGFILLRELGRAGHGGYLPFEALVAIHMAHRAFAVVAAVAVLSLTWALWRTGAGSARRFAIALLVLLVAQVLSGLSNVVLGWPIVAALGHSAGAAALVGVLGALWARWRCHAVAQLAPSRAWRAA
jgi:heme a synthase